jgi:hypothetical protein
MDKHSTLGAYVADALKGRAELKSGAAGSPPPAPGEGPRPQDMLADQALGEAMKPFYELAEQARRAEAERLARTIFGGKLVGNPVRSGISGLMAGKVYQQKLKPYLESVQRSLAGGIVPDVPVSEDSGEWAREQRARLFKRNAEFRHKRVNEQLALFRKYLADAGYALGEDGSVVGMGPAGGGHGQEAGSRLAM